MKQNKIDKTILTRNDLKERYKIGNAKASLLIHTKGFPSFKINGRYYVRLDKLIEYEEKAISKGCDLLEVILWIKSLQIEFID